MPDRSGPLLDRVRRLADDLLFPSALATDRAPIVPVAHLDALADAGLYGLYGPREEGGLDAGSETAGLAAEILAGACLATTFVWSQHHGAVVAVATAAPDGLRREWLGPLCRGERRAGVAFAHLRRPGPHVLTVRSVDGGVIFDGVAPWVTGWGRIDVVHTAARDAAGNVLWALVDASGGPTLRVEPLELVAVGASATVTARFDQHFVPAGRVTLVEPFAAWAERDTAGLRRNGSFPLGVAARCDALLGEAAFATEIAACRKALDASSPATVPAARAWAAELAMRAATVLVVTGGGRSVLASEHAQRLAREAVFLLVFGQTAAIKVAELERFRPFLAAPGSSG